MDNSTAKTILVVDDEEEALGHLRNILERADYNVLTATTGKEAVNLARSVLPDLIILDVVLPDIDGGEVSALLLKQPDTAKIPIIFLSGVIVRKEDNISGVKSGKHYVLAKPVTGAEVLDMVAKVLAGYS